MAVYTDLRGSGCVIHVRSSLKPTLCYIIFATNGRLTGRGYDCKDGELRCAWIACTVTWCDGSWNCEVYH